MRIIIAPGAFKHSLSAQAAAQAIQNGLMRSGLDADCVQLPIADGGNNTLDCFLFGGGKRISVEVVDPLQRPITAEFGLLPDEKTAVIEMALASGIELLDDNEHNPSITTTYGTGQLMQAALEAGASRFIIGMGGSATVDGGVGALQAIGVRFFNHQRQQLQLFGGGNLKEVAMVDSSQLDLRWAETEILIASDVDNPTLGNDGAAYVFGPQKGADANMILVLEENLNHFFTVIAQQTGKDVRELRGGGAAGALSAGLSAFLNAEITSGIDLLLAHYDFERQLPQTDLVITGEGQMDSQTIHGKGPIGVARIAQDFGVPTIAFVGGLAVDDAILHQAGIQAVLPIVPEPMSLAQALENAENYLEQAALRLGYLLQLNLG